ncbi:MAG: ABC transporter substrate-binding protein [Dehalococcoidia bacterium]|nr:ABC transporter substrate-binding protein [Dehalococcoidia bacterium]
MGQSTSYWDRLVAQRISRRRALQMSALGGATAAAIAVVGCGGSSKNASTPGAGGTAASTPGGGAGGGKPLMGGTLRSALNDPQSKFDAQKFPTFTVQTINSFSYSRLLKSTSGPDDPKTEGLDLAEKDWYRPVADLASSFENPDATTFVFTLQPGAKWQNVAPLNGRAVAPDDVVKSFDYYRARPDQGRNLAQVDAVTAVGSNQVQFKLKKAFGPFTIVISSPSDLWIYAPEMIATPDKLNSTMVGTGPFILRSYQQGVGAQWDKNPDYFGKDAQGNQLPYIDKLNFPVVPDKNNEFSQFTSGKLETITLPAELATTLKNQKPDARIVKTIANLLNFLFFPPAAFDPAVNQKPFNDERVRQAVSLALDREGLISLASGDTGGKKHNLINAGFLWYLDPESSEMGASAAFFKRDVQKAKQLLSAASASNINVDFVYPSNAYVTAVPYFNPVSEAIPPMLREAGINATIVTKDYQSEWINPSAGIFYGNLKSGIACALETPVNHPWVQFTNQFAQGSQRNHSKINDSEILGLIDQLGAETNFDKGRALAYQIQIANAKKMYYVPLVGPFGFGAYQSYVKEWAAPTSYGIGSESVPYYQIDTSKQSL